MIYKVDIMRKALIAMSRVGSAGALNRRLAIPDPGAVVVDRRTLYDIIAPPPVRVDTRMEKLRKMLALALSSTSEGERTAAIGRLQAVLATRGISPSDLQLSVGTSVENDDIDVEGIDYREIQLKNERSYNEHLIGEVARLKKEIAALRRAKKPPTTVEVERFSDRATTARRRVADDDARLIYKALEEEISAGMSGAALARAAAAKGLRTRRGGQWRGHVLARIIERAKRLTTN